MSRLQTEFNRGLVKYRNFTIVGVVAGVAVLLLGVSGWFGFQVLGLNQEIEKTESEIAKVSKKIEDFEKLAESDLMSKAEVIEAALPDTKPSVDTLTLLESLAQETEVSLAEFDFSPGVVSTGSASVNSASTAKNQTGIYEGLPISVEIEGRVAQVNLFLERIGKTIPLIDIDTIEIKPSGSDEEGFELFNGVLTLRIYWAKGLQANAKARDTAVTLSKDQLEVLEQLDRFLPEKSGDEAPL